MYYICRMSFKWYIGALIAMMSIFVVQQQDLIVHNQEIVLHFDNDAISTQDAQYSITLLTRQLEEAGAINVTAVLQESGRYKISYHSELNVAVIKEQLNTTEFQSFLANKKESKTLPFEDESSIYQMDVYDLQQDVTGFADTDKALFFEIKQDFNRGAQVNHPFLSKTVVTNPVGLLLQTVNGTNNSLGLSIADRSYAIPAVRAGPIFS